MTVVGCQTYIHTHSDRTIKHTHTRARARRRHTHTHKYTHIHTNTRKYTHKYTQRSHHQTYTRTHTYIHTHTPTLSSIPKLTLTHWQKHACRHNTRSEWCHCSNWAAHLPPLLHNNQWQHLCTSTSVSSLTYSPFPLLAVVGETFSFLWSWPSFMGHTVKEEILAVGNLIL